MVATVSADQLHLAGQGPARGWPAYAVMYPTGDPAQLIRDSIFASANYRNLDPNRGCCAGEPMGPLSRALAVAGAPLVDDGEFRTLGADSGLTRPLVGRDFTAWAPPERKASDEKERREWRLGVRLAPSASGELPQRIYDLGATHPGVRAAAFRGVTEALRCPGQVGYASSVATDAQLGFFGDGVPVG